MPRSEGTFLSVITFSNLLYSALRPDIRLRCGFSAPLHLANFSSSTRRQTTDGPYTQLVQADFLASCLTTDSKANHGWTYFLDWKEDLSDSIGHLSPA